MYLIVFIYTVLQTTAIIVVLTPFPMNILSYTKFLYKSSNTTFFTALDNVFSYSFDNTPGVFCFKASNVIA